MVSTKFIFTRASPNLLSWSGKYKSEVNMSLDLNPFLADITTRINNNVNNSTVKTTILSQKVWKFFMKRKVCAT